MTSFVQRLRFPLLLIATAVALPAAAAPIEHTIRLSATVPANIFYVIPTQGDWIGDVQNLDFNSVTGDLSSLTKPFTVLNTAGAISGRLINPAVISSGSDEIPLTVTFAGTALTGTAQEVVSASLAAAPREVNLDIAAIKPGTGYVAGNYAGNIELEFDAVP